VRTAHVILRIMLVGVGVTLTGAVLLIFDVVLGRSAAYIAAGCTFVMVILIATLPLALRVVSPKDAVAIGRHQAD